MRFYAISDNIDTQIGLRLAGIDGVVVHEASEVEKELIKAKNTDDIAILLITKGLSDLCPDIVDDIKLNSVSPLIVEIPDRHGDGHSSHSMAQYIRSAVGIKI